MSGPHVKYQLNRNRQAYTASACTRSRHDGSRDRETQDERADCVAPDAAARSDVQTAASQGCTTIPGALELAPNADSRLVLETNPFPSPFFE